MKKWCLGRFDFSLPDEFEPAGRSHSIYHVEAKTIPLNDATAQDRWTDRLREIEAAQPLHTLEVGVGYPAVFYQANPSMPHLITLEAQRPFDDHVLTLKYEGLKEKEADIKRLIEIAAEGYQPGIASGFCVGVGSITSKPSRNEHAMARFAHVDGKIELAMATQTPGVYLTPHPLDNVEDDIKYLATEGIRLDVLKNEERVVAGLDGFEGRVLMNSPNEEPTLRFTWFYAGVTADSFNPEILIEIKGPDANRGAMEAYWEDLLTSFRLREAS